MDKQVAAEAVESINKHVVSCPGESQSTVTWEITKEQMKERKKKKSWIKRQAGAIIFKIEEKKNKSTDIEIQRK